MNSFILCLALNIFWEARDQDIVGQLAVAQVVMNRVADDRYPNDPCDVITQGPVYQSGLPVRHRCQFSWWCDGKSDKPTDKTAMSTAFFVADIALTNKYKDVTKGATHYHADYVYPEWAETKVQTLKIGRHIFYRWETSHKLNQKN